MSNRTFPFAVVSLASCPVPVHLQNEFISFTSAHFHLVVEESNKTPLSLLLFHQILQPPSGSVTSSGLAPVWQLAFFFSSYINLSSSKWKGHMKWRTGQTARFSAGNHPATASFALGQTRCQRRSWQEGAVGQILIVTCNQRWTEGDIQPIQGRVNMGACKTLNGIFVACAEELFTGIPSFWKQNNNPNKVLLRYLFPPPVFPPCKACVHIH